MSRKGQGCIASVQMRTTILEELRIYNNIWLIDDIMGLRYGVK